MTCNVSLTWIVRCHVDEVHLEVLQRSAIVLQPLFQHFHLLGDAVEQLLQQAVARLVSSRESQPFCHVYRNSTMHHDNDRAQEKRSFLFSKSPLETQESKPGSPSFHPQG